MLKLYSIILTIRNEYISCTTALLATGVKQFATVYKVFTAVNLLIIVVIIAAGLTAADLSNWQWTPQDIYYEVNYGYNCNDIFVTYLNLNLIN